MMISNVERVPKEAIMESKEEGKLEVAERMLRRGMTVEQVVEMTGLSHNEIREIKRNM